MQLLTKQIRETLIRNHELQQEAGKKDGSIDFRPVVKLFNPIGGATWLITEMDRDEMMFGLCDLGHGFPELGYVYLPELEGIKLLGGALGIERDIHFIAKSTVSEYHNEAIANGRIVA
jgi:hypothetical protein